ncbi:MAG: hypothetical protein AB1531_08980, partial [Chloroflexota bacterium]
MHLHLAQGKDGRFLHGMIKCLVFVLFLGLLFWGPWVGNVQAEDEGTTTTSEETTTDSPVIVETGEEQVVPAEETSTDEPLVEVVVTQEPVLAESDVVLPVEPSSELDLVTELDSPAPAEEENLADDLIVDAGELGAPALDEVLDSSVVDPYFDRGGTRYYFRTNCTGYTNCTVSTTPLQAAIDDIQAYGMPDDSTIWVEAGTFTDTISIDGFSSALTIRSVTGAGNDVILTGSVTIEDNSALITLQGILYTATSQITLINNLAGTMNVTLVGGSGADNFLLDFSGSGIIAVTIDGLGGTDYVEIMGTGGDDVFSLGANTITLNSIDTVTYSNIEDTTVRGLTGNDTLNGPSTGITFDISGGGEGNAGQVEFRSIEYLVGGSGDDTFSMGNSGSLSGSITGGGGTDTYEGPDADLTYILTGIGQGTAGTQAFFGIESLVAGSGDNTLQGSSSGLVFTLTGIGQGTAGSLAFSGMDTLIGGSGDDTFQVNLAGDLFDLLDGGAGNDTLIGPNIDRTFYVNSLGSGTLGALYYSNFENLTGGSAVDTFLFGTAGHVTGVVRGGDGSDTAIIDGNYDLFTYTLGTPSTFTIITFPSPARNFLFGQVESIEIQHATVALDAADISTFLALVQELQEEGASLAGADLLGIGIPGVYSLYDDATGELIHETIGGILDPGTILQDHLVNQVTAYATTCGTGCTSEGLRQVLDTLDYTWTVPLQYLLQITASASAEFLIVCDASGNCGDAVNFPLDYQVSMQKYGQDDGGTIYATSLALGDLEALAHEGFSFDSTLSLTLNALMDYELVLSLSPSTDLAWLDFTTQSFEASATINDAALDLLYGFAALHTDAADFALDVRIDIATTDPTPSDGVLTTADLIYINDHIGSNISMLLSGTGMTIYLPLTLSSSIPGLTLSGASVTLTDANVFDQGEGTLSFTGMNALRPFSNLSAATVFGMLRQFGGWLQGLTASSLLSQNVPFTPIVLNQVLAFGNIFLENILSGLLDTNGEIAFDHAAGLASLLATLLVLDTSKLTNGWQYTSASHELEYAFLASYAVAPSGTLPVDLNYDYSPFSGLSISGGVNAIVSGTVDFEFIFGIDLDANLSAQIKQTEDTSLPTLVSFYLPDKSGQLSANASFTLSVTDTDDVIHNYTVTVTQAATADNNDITDLVADINNALPAGADAYVEARLVSGSEVVFLIQAEDASAGVKSLMVTDISNADELGLVSQSGSIATLQSGPIEAENGVISADASFDLTWLVGTTETTQLITLLASSTTTNTAIADLVTDLNAVLPAAVRAQVISGNSTEFELVGADTTVRSISVDDSSNAGLIGLATGSAAVAYPQSVNLAEVSPLVSPAVGAYTTGFSTSFDLALNSTDVYTINVVIPALSATDIVVDEVIDRVNLALASAGLGGRVHVINTFDARDPGTGLCAGDTGWVLETDPLTGFPVIEGGEVTRLYTRNCYGDRLVLEATDAAILNMKIIAGDGNLHNLGLEVGMYGRRYTDAAFVEDAVLSGTMTVGTSPSSFAGSLQLGFAGLNIAAATAGTTLDVQFDLVPPSGIGTRVILNELAANADEYDPANPAWIAPADSLFYDGVLYFAADDGSHGVELWMYDGTTTSLVADIFPGVDTYGYINHSNPSNLIIFGDDLYFSAEGASGVELYRYEPDLGTATLIDVNPGSGSSTPTDFVVFDNALYFLAENPTYGVELWKCDGTTLSVVDIRSGTASSNPAYPVVYDNVLYFSADGDGSGNEFWSYDGSILALVEDLNTSGGSNPSGLNVYDSLLYFMADDGSGYALYEYDGSNVDPALVVYGVIGSLYRNVVNITEIATAGANFPVTADADFGVSACTITLTFPNWFQQPSESTVSFPSGLNAARPLEHVTYEDVLDALDLVTDYLRALQDDADSRLNVALPLLGLSMASLLDYAAEFDALVERLRLAALPTVQALDAFLATLPGVTGVNLRLDGTDLRISFDHAFTQTGSLPLNINFPSLLAAPDNRLDGVNLLLAIEASGYLAVQALVNFELDLGLDTTRIGDPIEQVAFLDDSTNLTLSLSAVGQGMDFRAKLNSLDLFVLDGSAALNDNGDPASLGYATWNYTLTNNNGDNRHYFDEVILADTNTTVNGVAAVDLPLFYPTRDTPADAFVSSLIFTVTDLSDFLGGDKSVVLWDPNVPNLGMDGGILLNAPSLLDLLLDPETLLDGLDAALLLLQDLLNNQVFSLVLPFIGNTLADLAEAQWIDGLRPGILTRLANDLRSAAEDIDLAGAVSLITTAFTAIWGTGGLNILNSLSTSGCSDTDDYCEFDLDLDGTVTIPASKLPFTVGLDGIGLQVDAEVALTYAWTWHLTFGISETYGFYLDTADSAEMELALDGTISGAMEGVAQWIHFTATDGSNLHPAASSMDYTFTLDITDPDQSTTDGDGDSLTFVEMINPVTEPKDVMTATLNGSVETHIQLTIAFTESGFFPSLGADFDMSWIFVGVVLDPEYLGDLFYPASGSDLPDVAYNDVRINFGSFLSDYVAPILEGIRDVLAPFDWLIDPDDGLLYQVDPVMSFLMGSDITLLDEIEMLFSGVKQMRPFIDAIAMIYGVAKQVGTMATQIGGKFLELGDLVLDDYDGTPLTDWTVEEVEGKMENLAPDFLSCLKLSFGGDEDEIKFAKTFNTESQDKKRETEGSVGAGISGGFTFDFPIVTKSNSVLFLLAGQDVALVNVFLPSFVVNASLQQKFIVWPVPPVYILISATFTITIDVDFGYDTRGLRFYSITGLTEDIWDGFYIIVRDDEGERKAQLTLSLDLQGGAGVTVGLVDVSVRAGVTGTGYFYLHDPDNDGKVRWREIAEVAEANSGWIFDVKVKIDIYIKLVVEVFGVEVAEIGVSFTVYEEEFNITLPPRLGTTQPAPGGYILTLNMGHNSEKRKTGDLTDGDEYFTLAQTSFDGTRANLRITGTFPGYTGWLDPRITAYTRIIKVIGYGGEGNDGLIATGLDIPVEFHGGVGDDTLAASNHVDSVLYGDAGNDSLTAGTQGDELYGGNGNDTLTGGAGDDILDGGRDNDIITGGAGNDIITGGSGNDTLTGGTGDDTYIFTSFAGSDTVTENSGEGTDELDFSSAYGTLSGTIDNTGFHLAGMGYTVEASRSIENLLGSRGGGTLEFTATGDSDLHVDGLNGSDTYIVRFSPDYGGALYIEDTGAIWYTDRLYVHGTTSDDVISMTSSTFTATAPDPAAFVFDEGTLGDHGYEFFYIYLHAGNDTLNAAGSNPVNIAPIIYPDDKNDLGDDTLYGGLANETYIFLKNWGNDFLDAGEDTDDGDLLDFRSLDDRLLFRMGGAGGLDANALVEDLDATFTPIGSTLDFAWTSVEKAWSGTTKFDALQGRDEDSRWVVDGQDDQYIVPSVPSTMHFKYFERLYGGSAFDQMEFSGTQRYVIRGGAGDDRFIFNPGVEIVDLPNPPLADIESTLDGQGGIDTLDYSLFSIPVQVNLSLGSGTSIAYGDTERILNIENLLGGSADDTLTGDVSDNLLVGGGGDDVLAGAEGNDTYLFADNWGVDAVIETAGVGVDTLSFGGITLPGFPALDILPASADLDFHILTSGITVNDSTNWVTYTDAAPLDVENLTGGNGNDTFAFDDATFLPGAIDGGLGSDTLDYSAFNSSLDLHLTALGTSATGFAGMELSLGGGFDNIDIVLGGLSIEDALTGMHNVATFYIAALDNQYSVSISVLSFRGFEYLNGGGEVDHFEFHATNPYILESRGGAGDDIFYLFGTATVPGRINGQGGHDRLDYSAWLGGPVLVNLVSGIATAVFGDAAGGIVGIEGAVGTDDDDTLLGDLWNNYFDGRGGDDYILGAEGDDTLEGGTGDDYFVFLANWGNDVLSDVAGLLDTIDFSQVNAALTITIGLAGLTVNGAGTLTVTGNFIEQLLTGLGEDIFIFVDDGVGLAGSVGKIDASPGGTEANTLDYVGYLTTPVAVDLAVTLPDGFTPATGTAGVMDILNVFGGDAADDLRGDDLDNVLRGRGGNDYLDGRLGSDTIDESDSALDLTIDLSLSGSPQSTGLGSDILISIENIRTGSGDDTLTGDDLANLLDGGTGNDTYRFLDGWLGDTVTDVGGYDTFDFSAVTVPLTLAFGAQALITDGLGNTQSDLGADIEAFIGGQVDDQFELSGSQAVNLYGFIGDDTFIFAADAVLTGSLDGGTGSDTLDLHQIVTSHDVTLSGANTEGFTGSGTDLAAFSGVDILVGGGGTSNLLTGADQAALWTFDAADTYDLSGLVLTFSGFEILAGGSQDDTFAFQPGAVFDGSVEGGAQALHDRLDYSAYDAAVTINFETSKSTALTGTFAGIEDSLGSTYGDTLVNFDAGGTFYFTAPGTGSLVALSGTYTFTSFENLSGGAGYDIFDASTFAGPVAFDLTAVGPDGFDGFETITGFHFYKVDALVGTTSLANDSLTGLTAEALWTMVAASQGTYTDISSSLVLDFSSIESLIGENNLDVLSWQGYAGGVMVNLTLSGSLDGFNGSGTDLPAFENINVLWGSANADTFNGSAADALWTFTSSVYTYASGTGSVEFVSFEQLNGGAGDDTFAFDDGAVLAADIEGGGGTDNIDFGLLNSGAYAEVNLQTSTATGLLGNFSGIERMIGGPGNDYLIASNTSNIFQVTGSNDGTLNGSFDFMDADALVGGTLTNQFVFVDGALFAGYIIGNSGFDTLDFSAYL